MPLGRGREADQQLVERCLAGDGEAWAELVRTHETTVYFAVRNALRLRGSGAGEELVLDLVSEIFYRLVRCDAQKLSRYHGRCGLKHWLKVVAGNFVIDHLRKRRADCSLDDPDWSGVRETLRAATPTPEAALDLERHREVLHKLWGSLSPSDRRFVALFYERELGYEAVAAAMQTSVAAVYTRKSRVTQKLKVELARRQRRLKGAGS